MLDFLTSDDLLLNLFSEGIGIVVTTAIITPVIAIFISRRQAKEARDERLKMVPYLEKSYEPIHELLMSVENGSDADFIEAGLEAIRRKLNEEISEGPFNPSVEFALGNPHHIFATIKHRIDTSVQYIHSLIDLFAPHFRAADAYLAMEYLTKLKAPSEDLNKILQDFTWIASSFETFEKFSSHLNSVEESENTGGKEGVEMRQQVTEQMRSNIENKVHEVFTQYKSLDNRAKATQKSLTEFLSSLKSAGVKKSA